MTAPSPAPAAPTRFALMVLASPTTAQAARTAYEFARAAIIGGHSVQRVFFFHQGVDAGNSQLVPAPDTPSLTAQWAALAAENNIDLVVCVTSAVRRGVLDAGEAKRHDRTESLHAGFEISGLGQWVEACLLADRVVSFG